MNARLIAAVFAAVALPALTAAAACPPGGARGCVNLDNLSDITQQIVAREQPVIAPKRDVTAPGDGTSPGYTGPMVGLTNTVRRTPTVGYHWTLD